MFSRGHVFPHLVVMSDQCLGAQVIFQLRGVCIGYYGYLVALAVGRLYGGIYTKVGGGAGDVQFFDPVLLQYAREVRLVETVVGRFLNEQVRRLSIQFG